MVFKILRGVHRESIGQSHNGLSVVPIDKMEKDFKDPRFASIISFKSDKPRRSQSRRVEFLNGGVSSGRRATLEENELPSPLS